MRITAPWRARDSSARFVRLSSPAIRPFEWRKGVSSPLPPHPTCKSKQALPAGEEKLAHLLWIIEQRSSALPWHSPEIVEEAARLLITIGRMSEARVRLHCA